MPAPTLSRRSVIRTVAHASVIAALFRGHAYAATAEHPIVGSWLATTPQGPAHAVFAPFGEAIIAWPHSEDIEAGTFPYTTAATGAWRPTGPSSLHFLVIEILSDRGLAADYATFECELEVDVSGETFQAAPGATAISCGSTGNGSPDIEVSGYRMWLEE